MEVRWRRSGGEVEEKWKRGGGEVEMRWRRGGDEVEERWKRGGGEEMEVKANCKATYFGAIQTQTNQRDLDIP